MSAIKGLYDRIMYSRFRLSPAYEKLYNLAVLNLPERAFSLLFSYVRDHGIRGDYLEFGVARGNSFVKNYHISKTRGVKWLRYFAFDSFSGLPPFKGVDTSFSLFKPGMYAYSRKEFLGFVKSHGVKEKDIVVIEGYYKDSLRNHVKTEHHLEKAAVILIDCDLYESAKQALNFCTSIIQDGTAIYFDDFAVFDGSSRLGERKAFAEWLKANKLVAHPFPAALLRENCFLLEKRR